MKTIFYSIILIFLFLINSYATRETIIQVVQPNVIEESIEESTSTYIYYIGYPFGYSVGLTCAANQIQTQSKVENRNIANIFGLESKLNYDEHALNSDTLGVDLIIPETVIPPDRYKHHTLDEVIKSTINCLILNASSYDRIKYLDLKIKGDLKFSGLSKIIKLEHK
jgi:hypothetical protein